MKVLMTQPRILHSGLVSCHNQYISLELMSGRGLQQGAQGMDATDRAVAIRTLIVSTAREAPEVALESALKQILRYRKAAA